jgi:hypothetical protein
MYIHTDVIQVRELHSHILSAFEPSGTLYDLLDQLASNLYQANKNEDERSLVEIKNYLKPGEFEQVNGIIRIDRHHANEIMARQHGFSSWEEVKYGGRISIQPLFEEAVEYTVWGRVSELSAILKEFPHLIIQRSAFFHKATLLHYVSSNGVEIRRQLVPGNLVDIIRLLLEYGADPEAKGYFYGKMTDTLSLLQSGTHTRNAGVYEDALKILT